MAQDFNSMFGMVSPQDAEAAYLARQQVSPNTMAQLPLLNQVVAMGGNAGAGLGNSVGRMLGGQTSVEAEQALMKNIFSKAAAQSPDPMERLKIAAAEFDKIDPAKAQALRLEATKLEEAKAKSDERSNVGINKERMADLVQKQNPAMPRGEALAVAGNPTLIAKMLDPEAAKKNERHAAIGQALSGRVPGLTPEMGAAIAAENPALTKELFNPELKTNIVTTEGSVQLVNSQSGAVIKDFGKPQDKRTTINTGDKGDTKFVEKLAEIDAGVVKDAMSKRSAAQDTIRSLARMEDLSAKGVTSGSFAPGRVAAAKFMNTIGLLGKADVAKMANSENFAKEASSAALGIMGGKLGAGFSEGDRIFIVGIVPQLETSPAARKELIQFMINKQKDVIKDTVELEAYARKNNGLGGFTPKYSYGGGVDGLSKLSDDDLASQIQALQAKQKK